MHHININIFINLLYNYIIFIIISNYFLFLKINNIKLLIYIIIIYIIYKPVANIL
jgi:hypothetical protein